MNDWCPGMLSLFLLLIIIILIFLGGFYLQIAASEPKLCEFVKFLKPRTLFNNKSESLHFITANPQGVGHLLNNYMMSFDSIIYFMKLTIMPFSLLEIAMLANRMS